MLLSYNYSNVLGIEIDSKSPPICCTTDTMQAEYHHGVPLPVSITFLILLIHQLQTSLITITMSMSTMTVLTVLLHPNWEYCLNRLQHWQTQNQEKPDFGEKSTTCNTSESSTESNYIFCISLIFFSTILVSLKLMFQREANILVLCLISKSIQLLIPQTLLMLEIFQTSKLAQNCPNFPKLDHNCPKWSKLV